MRWLLCLLVLCSYYEHMADAATLATFGIATFATAPLLTEVPQSPPAGTLCVIDLLACEPYEAYITRGSWQKSKGHCRVNVRWGEFDTDIWKFNVGLLDVSTGKSLKGSDDFLASDMVTVKQQLAKTIKYRQENDKVPKGLRVLLLPPTQDGGEADDDLLNLNDVGASSSSSSSSSSSYPSRERTSRDFLEAGPANDTKMNWHEVRGRREAGYEKALFGGLENPCTFRDAAVLLPDPADKASGIEKNILSAAGPIITEMRGLMLELKGQLESADEAREELEEKVAEAEAEAAAAKAEVAKLEANAARQSSALESASKANAATKRQESTRKKKIEINRSTLKGAAAASSSIKVLSGDQLTRAAAAAEQQLIFASSGSEENFNLTLMRLLERPLVQELSDFATLVSKASVDKAIVDRLVDAIAMLKKKCNNTHERIAYEAILIAAAPSSDDELSGFVKRLGVQFKTIKARQEQRSLLDEGEATAVWFHESVAPNARAFVNKDGGAMKEKYDVFWRESTNVTNVDPSTSSKITKHSKGRCWHKGECDDDCEHHLRYYLQVTLEEAWEIFNDKCPELVQAGCGRSVFFSLVPWWVKKPKSSTCNCIYHSQAQLLIRCYRHVMIDAHKNCDCDCDFCGGGDKCGPILEALNSQSIFADALCGTEKTEAGTSHHKAACVNRKCTTCGPSGSKIFPLSGLFGCPRSLTDDPAKFKIITTEEKKQTVTDEEGFSEEKTVKHTIKKEEESTRKKFTALLQEHLVEYLPHRHAAHYNAEQFDGMIDGLINKPNGVIMLMDFGMNYSHVHPDETQGEFWAHVQTTVLPIVVYRKVGDQVWAESYVFLSDDLKHDNDFVRHCVGLLVGELEGKGTTVDSIDFWSDGCAAQFKLKKQIYFTTQPEMFIPGKKHAVRMNHHFFCSCHGKGPSDAETAVTKSKGRTLEGNNTYMAFPIDFYTKVKEKLENFQPVPVDKKQRHSLRLRKFFFVKRSDVKRVAVEFKGLESQVAANHSFRSVGRLGQGKRQWLPCSCSGCSATPRTDCKNKIFNEPEADFEVSMDRPANTKTLDERLTERSSKLSRRMKSSSGGGAGSVVALYLNNGEGEAQWTAAEVASAPRQRKSSDVIDNRKQRASKKDQDMVLDVYRYEREEDTSGNDRALFSRPSKEKCDAWIHSGCKCGNWHRETTHAVAMRPPITSTGELKRDFKEVDGYDGLHMEMHQRKAQKIDETCDEDEAFQQSHSHAYLPTNL